MKSTEVSSPDSDNVSTPYFKLPYIVISSRETYKRVQRLSK